jgi:hypothetical protein
MCKRKCDVCYKHNVKVKDYRFIESCGLQGKVLSCKWCFNLNDVAVCQIVNEGLNPKEFYNKNKEVIK